MKWGIHFNLAHKEERVKELEQIMEDPDFWSDTDRAQGYMKELKNLKDELDEYKHLKQSFEDVQTFKLAMRKMMKVSYLRLRKPKSIYQ